MRFFRRRKTDDVTPEEPTDTSDRVTLYLLDKHHDAFREQDLIQFLSDVEEELNNKPLLLPGDEEGDDPFSLLLLQGRMAMLVEHKDGFLLVDILQMKPTSLLDRPSIETAARRYYFATQAAFPRQAVDRVDEHRFDELVHAENDIELALKIIDRDEWQEFRDQHPRQTSETSPA